MVELDKKKILSLVDFSFSLNHLVKGTKVMDALKEIVPDVNIEDLPIAYTAVATDWNSGREVVFSKGSLYEAIRSSISIPLFFNPVRRDNMLLVDGGLVNALPLNRVKRTRGDLLVGVNVSTHDYKEEQFLRGMMEKKMLIKSLPASIVQRIMSYQEGLGPNYLTLLSRTISIMLEQNTRQQILISEPDIMVQVQMRRYGGFDYDKAAQISRIGEHKMRKALKEYEQAHSSFLQQLKFLNSL
jgi:NTE family protein